MMTAVSITSGNDPEKMVSTSLERLGGLEQFVSGNSALIKPNLGPWIPQIIPKYVNQWATTNPIIVGALIKELQRIGIEDIAVADGAFLDLDATAQLDESGMRTVVEAAGGRVIDLDQGNHVRVKVADTLALEIAEPVLKTDNLINVPVMKTHVQTKLTLGIKNLKGVVSKASKRVMHRGDLERSLALLCQALKPKLTLVDGLLGMEGLGPAVFGKPTVPGLLVAGCDPVAVDAVTATIMGHDPYTIDHIVIANQLGLGEIDIKNITIHGLPLQEAIHPFEPAQVGVHNIVQELGLEGIRYFGADGAATSECTGCIDTLLNALIALKSDVKGLKRPLDIVIGSRDLPENIGENLLLYGRCQAKNQNKGTWLSECPPSIRDTYSAVAKMTLSRTEYLFALIKRLYKGTKVNPLPHWEQYKDIAFP
jgi:uncharacterized protein (DUF362 family)